MAVQTIANLQVDQRLEAMVEAAHAAGCPRDQVERFLAAGYIPLPHCIPFHAAARSCDRAGGPIHIAMGGSRGPGKSHAAYAQVAEDCQRFDGLKVLFLRKIQKSAAESMEDLTIKVFRYITHKLTNDGVELPNGSRVIMGGFKDESDIEKYLGIEYDLIVIEECTQITKEKWDKIRGSLRSTKPGWRARIYLTTNADGVGLAWFKKEFVTPAREGTQTTTRFFDLSYTGNPMLAKEYIDYLDGLHGPLRAAWRDADWDAFAGMAFPLWNHSTMVIDPIEIPPSWPKWRAVDWGFSAPWCCLWLARDPDTGRVYVYREAYQAELTDARQVEYIKTMTPEYEKISMTYADPALWERKPNDDAVYTTAGLYNAKGVPLTRANNDRIGGKRKVDRLMGNLRDGMPGLMVFNTCPHLIDQLETLALDKIRTEDVDTDQEDHAFDTLKYGLTSISNPDKAMAKKAEQVSPLSGISYL